MSQFSFRPQVESLVDRIVPARLSVSDATITEGNSGTQYAQVTVRLDVPSSQTVTVNYATQNGSAASGSDYGAISGKLTFARGQTSKTITVPVYGDRLSEANESFSVVLSRAKGATIRDGTGVVTVAEDEPRLSISNASGTVVYTLDGSTVGTTLYFTVSLAAAYDQTVTVNYATADGTSAAGVDYLAASGTLTFAPGETTKTIAVTVTGNDSYTTESFYMNLSGASANARIVDDQGVGAVSFYVEQPYVDPGDGCSMDNPYWPNC